jgi:integral membrane sensor domain MASE1
MSASGVDPTEKTSSLTNGPGAAAILAAGIGSLALSLLAIVGDKFPAAKSMLVFYKPTGVLSGVTTVAIVIWLGAWGGLEIRWRKRTVALGMVSWLALGMLVLSILLTFPPIADLF